MNDPAGVQLAALRAQQATSPPGTNSAAAAAAVQAAAVAARVAAAAAAGLQGLGVGVGVPGLGAVQNEDIRVPDKMVGLSKYEKFFKSLESSIICRYADVIYSTVVRRLSAGSTSLLNAVLVLQYTELNVTCTFGYWRKEKRKLHIWILEERQIDCNMHEKFFERMNSSWWY